MNKLWIVILLSCSTNSGASAKADFALKWQAEKNQAIDSIPHSGEGQNKWRQPPSSFSLPEQKSRLPDMFGRVDKPHRLRYSDPNFSSFNSDEGYSVPH